MALPTFEDVLDASKRLDGTANRTPVLTSRGINAEVGSELFFKCENFQRSGAFKFRGAFNALSRFTSQQRRRGVVAYSSGNHAQAVALSATLLDIPATIVMPTDAPRSKLNATKGYGATVVAYDRYREDREQIAQDLSTRHGMTLIPPYDHADIIAGQGTAAKELFDEVDGLDALLLPLGGGGLLSGSILAALGLAEKCAVYGVEPATADDGRRSLQQGSIVHIDVPTTIADGAQTTHLGELTFAIIKEHVADILTATDDELVESMRVFASSMKILVEPTGCLGLAAAQSEGLRGQRIGIIVSGGNVDLDRYAALLTR
ncbi:MAG: threo-3-hydroxy-L-aspartate ammonia-lyase [Nakamurella sp.]